MAVFLACRKLFSHCYPYFSEECCLLLFWLCSYISMLMFNMFSMLSAADLRWEASIFTFKDEGPITLGFPVCSTESQSVQSSVHSTVYIDFMYSDKMP